MRHAFVFFLLLLSFQAFADDRGGETSGGGDLCEARIQNIRDDLRVWILKGGAKSLVLKDLTPEEYAKAMETHFQAAKISCVGPGDPGYPVNVKGTPKTCRFDIISSGERITCDIAKFEATGPSGQYMLIHHEYAGLAGFEKPEDDVSSYVISNQIPGFLEERTEKKMGTDPRPSAIFRFPFFGRPVVLDCTDAHYYSAEYHPNFTMRKFSEQPGYPRCRTDSYSASGKSGVVAFSVKNPAVVHFYPDGSVAELYSMGTYYDQLTVTLAASVGSFEQPMTINVAFHPNGTVYWVRNGGNRFPNNQPLKFKYPNGRKAAVRQILFKENGSLDRVEECEVDSNNSCR